MDSFTPPVANPFTQPIAVAKPQVTQDTPPWAVAAEPVKAAPPPMPTNVAQEPKYWVSTNGNVDNETFTRTEVQRIISTGPGQTFMVCGTAENSAWQSPVEAGFSAPVSKPKPPAMPSEPVAAMPKPAAPPALPPTTSTPPPVMPPLQASPAAAVLTEEEKQDYADLKAKFDAGSLPSAELMKFLQYVHRIEKA